MPDPPLIPCPKVINAGLSCRQQAGRGGESFISVTGRRSSTAARAICNHEVAGSIPVAGPSRHPVSFRTVQSNLSLPKQEVDTVLTLDTPIPQELTDACEAIVSSVNISHYPNSED